MSVRWAFCLLHQENILSIYLFYALKILRKLHAFNIHSLALLPLLVPPLTIFGKIFTIFNDTVNALNYECYIIKIKITGYRHHMHLS